MRVLVTGASGLLGINLALEAAQDHTVFGVIDKHAIVSKDFGVLQRDLLASNGVRDVLDQAQPEWIIHCAAMANLDACEKAPEIAYRMNAELPGRMASAAVGSGIRFLHISTDAVFDGKHGGYCETDKTNPLSVYAETKLAGERAVADANQDAVIVRVNFYGFSLSGTRSLAEFFLNNLLAGNPMKGFTDVHFCPLLVNDLAKILLTMLTNGLSGLYHVVSSESMSKYDFGVALARRFGLNAELIEPFSVEASELQASRAHNLTLRTDKISQELNFVLPGIQDGLDRFFDLYRNGYAEQIREMGVNTES